MTAFRAQLAIARDLDLPVVIHCRDATDDCFELLAAEAPPTVVLHCFAAVDRLDEAVERGWYCSFAGNVTYGSAIDLRRPPDACRTISSCSKPTRRTSPPSRTAARRTSLHTSWTRSAFVAGLRDVAPAALDDRVESNAARAFHLRVNVPRRSRSHGSPTLGITPDTRLGQHFLVDDNLVRVALRLADLRPDDVVLEVGPGLGVLTAALADAVRHVHAIEIDRRLEPALAIMLDGHANVTVRFEDAVDVDASSLAPAPTAFVSNLPYNVATPLIAESLSGLPTVDRWAVMIQRELGDRLFAAPGTAAYGAPSRARTLAASAPAATACRAPCSCRNRTSTPPWSAFRRRATGRSSPRAWSRIVALVHAAFGHGARRSPTRVDSRAAPRSAVDAALCRDRLPTAVRAEALPPESFVALRLLRGRAGRRPAGDRPIARNVPCNCTARSSTMAD